MKKGLPKPVWSATQHKYILTIYEDGKRVKEFTSTDFNHGEEKCLRSYKGWLQSGKQKPPNSVSVLYEQYLDNCKATYCDRAMQNKRSMYECYIKPAIGKKKIADVEEKHLQAIINDHYKRGKGLSKTMLRHIKAEIMAFYRYCTRIGVVTITPIIDIPKNARSKGKQIIPDEAIRELFDPKYDDYPSVNFYRMMLVGGGLRPGECCGIIWSDINGNRLTIRRAINLQGQITQGKNENALRTIILSDIAIQILEKQRSIQERNGIVSEWVFGYDGANQPSLHRLYKRWHGVDRGKGTTHTKGLADLLNCPTTSLYSFRHTFVTLCESDGVDLTTLRPLLGHSACMDTYGTYGRVNDALRKKAAQNVDDVFKMLLSS